MKITKVEAIPVSYPEPNDFDALRHLCLARIEADDGAVGWGESVTMWPEASFATKAIIEGISDLVVGQDPVGNDAIHHSLKDRAWWYGYEGGIASFAIAAIDIALWDLKGKALGSSLLDLLGGPVHERLPAIASSHAHHESIPDMADEAVEWLSTGLRGMKVGFGKRGNARLGFEHDRDVEYVRAMREAIGPDKTLMIDLGWLIRWDVSTAIKRTKAFDEYGIDERAQRAALLGRGPGYLLRLLRPAPRSPRRGVPASFGGWHIVAPTARRSRRALSLRHQQPGPLRRRC